MSRRASTRLTVFTLTGTAVLRDSLNPWSDTFTSYVPACTFVNVYAPTSLDTVLRVRFVSRLVMLTVAPGRVAPLLSSTFPTMLPYSTCALATGGCTNPHANSNAAAPTTIFH